MSEEVPSAQYTYTPEQSQGITPEWRRNLSNLTHSCPSYEVGLVSPEAINQPLNTDYWTKDWKYAEFKSPGSPYADLVSKIVKLEEKLYYVQLKLYAPVMLTHAINYIHKNNGYKVDETVLLLDQSRSWIINELIY